MNFRITSLLFALFLTMLWVFGLMIAQKKAAGDQAFILATMRGPKIKIDKVVIKQADNENPVEFVSIDDKWFLKDDKQQVRVEAFRVDQQIIKQLRDAKHEETADVSKSPAYYELNKPHLVVTLSGKADEEAKEWKLLFGKENADKTQIYVTSSDRPDKVYSVVKKDIDSIFIKNPNYLRSRRLFDFGETGVTGIQIQHGNNPLEVTRSDGMWTFVKPPLGPAGFESEPEEKKDPHDFMNKKKPQPKATTGVKGLLGDIINIQVDDQDDFVALGKPASAYGVEAGKETTMRIQISSADKKELSKEVLLVGDKVKSKGAAEYYYARLDSDDGVVKINAKRIAPILAALADPGKLRSLDVAAFDAKKVDAIGLKQGKDETWFYLQSTKADPKAPFPAEKQESQWYMIHGKDKKKASLAAITTLIDQVEGKRGIVAFVGDGEADPKKKDAERGLEPPVAEIAIYLEGVDKAKTDEKKDDKKETKKDDKNKKNEPAVEPLPTLKKNAKAVITLAIGKIEGDFVYVRRTLEDGKTTSRFKMKKEFVEKVLPKSGVALAYLDTELPSFEPHQVTAFTLKRTTDKGPETLDLERQFRDGDSYWYVKSQGPDASADLADVKNAEFMIGLFSHLSAKQWIETVNEKDLDRFGLKNPAASVAFTVKKNLVTPAAVATSFGAGIQPSVLPVVAGLLAQRQLDKGETITIEFGKEADAKDKTTYARHSGSKLLFVVDSNLVKFVKEKDLRDRSFMLNSYGLRLASLAMIAAGDPVSTLNFASPQVTGVIHRFDPDKVKDVRIVARTPYELRAFHFERVAKKQEGAEPKEKDIGKAKDKTKVDEKAKEGAWTWVDKSGIPEFKLDPEKVAQIVKDYSKLQTDRFVSYAGKGPNGAQILTGGDYKMDEKDLTIKIDLTFEDGKTVTVKVGASFQTHGHFTHSSYWPEVVFFAPMNLVEPILRGPSFFGKEHATSN